MQASSSPPIPHGLHSFPNHHVQQQQQAPQIVNTQELLHAAESAFAKCDYLVAKSYFLQLLNNYITMNTNTTNNINGNEPQQTTSAEAHGGSVSNKREVAKTCCHLSATCVQLEEYQEAIYYADMAITNNPQQVQVCF